MLKIISDKYMHKARNYDSFLFGVNVSSLRKVRHMQVLNANGITRTIMKKKRMIAEMGDNISVRLLAYPFPDSKYGVLLSSGEQNICIQIDHLLEELGAAYSFTVVRTAIEAELDLTERMQDVCKMLKAMLPGKIFIYENRHPYGPYIFGGRNLEFPDTTNRKYVDECLITLELIDEYECNFTEAKKYYCEANGQYYKTYFQDVPL